MKPDHRAGTWPVCITILVILATIAIAGCVDSPQEPQSSRVTSAGDVPAEHSASGTTIPTTMIPESTTRTPAQPASLPVSSTGVIQIDPIPDKTAGEKFTLTGKTSLPPGTNIIWQILPDTGTPPTGLDKDSMMSVGGNYLVTKGDGTANRLSLDIDLGRLIPGKYVAIVGAMNGDEPTGSLMLPAGSSFLSETNRRYSAG